MSVEVDTLDPEGMQRYARTCAWVLAQGHARSGSASTIAGYMGSGDVFPEAVTGFGVKYAAQNEADYAAFASQVGFPTEEAADSEAMKALTG